MIEPRDRGDDHRGQSQPGWMEARAVWVGPVLGAAAALVYLATAPAVVNLDGLGYLKLLEHNFAAGHLLYMPLLRAATRLAHGNGLGAGRALDAILGGVGVVLLYDIARLLHCRRSASERLLAASFAACGLALSYGYWVEAADLEAYAAATVALLALVRMLLAYAARPSVWRAAATGVLLGGAVLCHIEHALAALLVAVYLHRQAPAEKQALGHPALALGVGGALALGGYAYAALIVRDHDLAGAVAWVRTSAHGFSSGGGLYKLADAVYGLAKSLVYAPYLDESNAQKLLGQFLLGLAPLLGLLALYFVHGGRAVRRSGLWACWILPYTVVGVAFFGSDPERWLFVLPALWLIAAELVLRSRRRLRLVALTLVYLGAVNLVTAIWPAHVDAWPKQRAEAVAGLLRDGDLLLFPGHSWDEYVSFYGAAHIVPFPFSYYAARDGIESCLGRAGREIERARARDGRIYAVRLFDDLDDRRGFYEMAELGLDRATLHERLLDRFSLAVLRPLEGVAVYRLDR